MFASGNKNQRWHEPNRACTKIAWIYAGQKTDHAHINPSDVRSTIEGNVIQSFLGPIQNNVNGSHTPWVKGQGDIVHKIHGQFQPRQLGSEMPGTKNGHLEGIGSKQNRHHSGSNSPRPGLGEMSLFSVFFLVCTLLACDPAAGPWEWRTKPVRVWGLRSGVL